MDDLPPQPVDFLSEKNKVIPHERRRSPILRFLATTLILLMIVFGAFSVGVISSGESLSRAFGNLSLWTQIKRLVTSNEQPLQGERDGRINVLLLGIGGEGHDGPYLADTMIVASLNTKTKQVAMISIPRDLLVNIPGHGWRKINHADAFGEASGTGNGGELASQVVEEVLGIPMHYSVRVDFAGFVAIINDLGGITVNVEHVLDDETFPVPGQEAASSTEDRYEHLYLTVGKTHMSGELALKYARSRSAKGSEGSDFARSRRQQNVILAAKEKALSLSTIGNPIRISRLMDTVSQHITTNLQLWEIVRLSQLIGGIQQDQIIHRVFDDSPTGPLVASIAETGAYVLQPKAGNFSELQRIAQNIFATSTTPTPSITPAGATTTPAVVEKPARLEIHNGTTIEGLAGRTAAYLRSLNYDIIRTSNAPTQDYNRSVVYVITDSNTARALGDALVDLLKIERATSLPTWITTSNQVSSQSDVLLILGTDATTL